MLVHVILGNVKRSFALQEYSFEEYLIPVVWLDVVYCADIGIRIDMEFFKRHGNIFS